MKSYLRKFKRGSIKFCLICSLCFGTTSSCTSEELNVLADLAFAIAPLLDIVYPGAGTVTLAISSTVKNIAQVQQNKKVNTETANASVNATNLLYSANGGTFQKVQLKDQTGQISDKIDRNVPALSAEQQASDKLNIALNSNSLANGQYIVQQNADWYQVVDERNENNNNEKSNNAVKNGRIMATGASKVLVDDNSLFVSISSNGVMTVKHKTGPLKDFIPDSSKQLIVEYLGKFNELR